MRIQTLSVSIKAPCPNNCPFCISKLNKSKVSYNSDDFDFLTRMSYAKDVGCDTLLITGQGEPLANLPEISRILKINRSLPNPFTKIDLQTSGVGLLSKGILISLKNLGVTTICISMSSFASLINQKIMHTPKSFNLVEICDLIKKTSFTLRIVANINKIGFSEPPEDFFTEAKKAFRADQLIIRKLFLPEILDKDTEEIYNWIKENRAEKTFNSYVAFLKTYGKPLDRLAFGAKRYSLNGMSIIFDDDCMNKEHLDMIRYLVLRENGKLYSHWDDLGTIIF